MFPLKISEFIFTFISLKISSSVSLLKGNLIFREFFSLLVKVYPPIGTLISDSGIIYPFKTAATCVEVWPESNPIPVRNPAPNKDNTT